jgi:hypothetical protein
MFRIMKEAYKTRHHARRAVEGRWFSGNEGGSPHIAVECRQRAFYGAEMTLRRLLGMIGSLPVSGADRSSNIHPTVPVVAGVVRDRRRPVARLGNALSPEPGERTMKAFKPALALGLICVLATTIGAVSASAAGTPLSWTGNGTAADADGRVLDNERCDESATPYLSWVLSGTKATSATLTIGDSTAVTMDRANGDKKGVSTFKHTWQPGSPIDLDALVGTVSAHHNDPKNKAVLTVSHGCLGESDSAGLQIVFLGELVNPGDGWTYANQGVYAGSAFDVCENATTNCVSFALGTTPNTTRTLTLGTTPAHLSFPETPEFCIVLAYDSSVVATSPFLMTQYSSYLGMFFNESTTTSTFGNTDTVYLVHSPGC